MQDMFRAYSMNLLLWLGILITVHLGAQLFFLEHKATCWMVGTFVFAGVLLSFKHMYFDLARILSPTYISRIIPMWMFYRDRLVAEFSSD